MREHKEVISERTVNPGVSNKSRRTVAALVVTLPGEILFRLKGPLIKRLYPGFGKNRTWCLKDTGQPKGQCSTAD